MQTRHTAHRLAGATIMLTLPLAALLVGLIVRITGARAIGSPSPTSAMRSTSKSTSSTMRIR